MKELLKRVHQARDEEGFTLGELLFVVVIIGILTLITLPIFSNQQKEGIRAALETDLRNAALAIVTETATNNGRYPAWVPSYSAQSMDNYIYMDQQKSNYQVFCLIGKNPALTETYYYSSTAGFVTTTPCPDVFAAGSNQMPFATANTIKLSGKKALVTYHSNASSTASSVRSQVNNLGFQTVDIKTQSEFAAMSDSQIAEYEVVFAVGRAWTIGGETRAKLQTYFDQGGKIVQDGNDSTADAWPYITNTIRVNHQGAKMIPTYSQGLRPAFPYTFTETSFNSDSGWQCALAVKNGAVVIADTQIASGVRCVTVGGVANGAGGRWLYYTWIENLSVAPVKAGIDWVLY